NEKNTTRARANILREIITNPKTANPFNDKDIYEVLDLCLLCKACKSECPSGVDVAKLKMEFLQHYYDANHIPIRAFAVGILPRIHKLGAGFPNFVNFFLKNSFTSSIIKKIINFHNDRDFPLMSRINLKKWSVKNLAKFKNDNPQKTIYLFNDEFTNYLESDIGIVAIKFFGKLGYDVKLLKTLESGRTWLSKGLIRKAQKIANKNIEICKNYISPDSPLIGIEPSAILSFRDEYPDLAYDKNREFATKLAANTMLFDEFISKEISLGNINSEMFTTDYKEILFHGHCQQKSLITTKYTKKILNLPKNYKVEEIPSGCCGMAGSFGYEKEHYELSMKIGELVLFPSIRNAAKNTIISAVGTSCRCQIKDGTNVDALHPLEILYDALIDK
ncbi:FAD-binding oxidoreductase, partial [Bacteroidales bacterium OttesenSCG-928-I21]|nr:FAD-binding oxidoreductase [Bacteroidales bacterium OttesenSCG-928-I21]